MRLSWNILTLLEQTPRFGPLCLSEGRKKNSVEDAPVPDFLDADGLPLKESAKLSHLYERLQEPPSVELWNELRHLLDSWENTPLREEAFENVLESLESWPPGLRETTLRHKDRLSFFLADCVSRVEYRRHSKEIRKSYPHLNCHLFSSVKRGTAWQQKSELLESLSTLTGSRMLVFLPEIDTELLEVIAEQSQTEGLQLVRCPELDSLQPLRKMTSLHTLIMGRNHRLDELWELEKVSSLRHLRLRSFQRLTELVWLKDCSELQSLSLEHCDYLFNLDGLEGCESLEHLELVNCKVGDLSPLSGTTSLKRLRLELLPIRSLEGLGELEKLEELVIEDCDFLEDFQALHRLKGLRRLRLVNVDWDESSSALSSLESLEQLELSHVRGMEDLKCLRGLKNLKVLRVDGDESMTSLEGLEQLTSLESLEMTGVDRLVEVEPLSGLTALRKLYLGKRDLDRMAKEFFFLPGHGPSSKSRERKKREKSWTEEQQHHCQRLFQQLLSLQKLEELFLRGMPELPELSLLSELSRLRVLDLEDCQQRFWEIGRGFSALETLSLRRCKELTGLYFDCSLPSLQKVSLYDCGELKELETELLQGAEVISTKSLLEKRRERQKKTSKNKVECRDYFQ